ncbi:MAG TPA: serine acetyltransferase [Phycisphaerae bacterium]|nr:serine acetyltransferase [Phycisphaerae bacterium]
MMDSRPCAREADWSRERIGWLRWSPGGRLVRAIRSYQRWRAWGVWGTPLRWMAAVRVRLWNMLCGCDVPPDAQLGGGLIFPHANGIILHPNVQVGVNCMIFQQVTIGIRGSEPGAPRIGGHVDIGAGAKILGGIVIGDHAQIGANAVVLTDVPAGATAVGVPARIILPKRVSVIEITNTMTAAMSDRGIQEILNAAQEAGERMGV